MKTMLALFALALLSACSTWVNPNVEPGKLDDVRSHDVAYCQKVSDNLVPIQQGNILNTPSVGYINQISNYNMQWDASHRQQSAFERCMANRGWVKQDTF